LVLAKQFATALGHYQYSLLGEIVDHLPHTQLRIPVKTSQSFQFKTSQAFSFNAGQLFRSGLGRRFQLDTDIPEAIK